MNRSQRRRLEKDLGITKHKQQIRSSGNAEKIYKSIREGMEAGKERTADTKEKRRREANADADAQAAQETSSLATTIMLRDGLEWHDALEAAKKEISERYQKESD